MVGGCGPLFSKKKKVFFYPVPNGYLSTCDCELRLTVGSGVAAAAALFSYACISRIYPSVSNKRIFEACELVLLGFLGTGVL